MVLVGLNVWPMVIIGGLDSLTGTRLGALAVGLLESLTAGYLDPLVGVGLQDDCGLSGGPRGAVEAPIWVVLGTSDIERV